MGYFDLQKKFLEKKKNLQIKKLAIAEERAQKKQILDEKRAEIAKVNEQIRLQKGKSPSIPSFGAGKVFKKGSIAVAKGVIATGKGVGKVLEAAATNAQSNQRRSKKKKNEFDIFQNL